ncbi:MAG TPA: hypothetical protein VMZ53_03145 [Kofleriaceae bacterium]|nr:hypothetical protein [Kofleriaceae bacterium]
MTLDKETRRPRLRTASMLFGVVAASSTAGAATHYALCDREGAPACGNIGQLGREAPPPVEVHAEPAPAPITNTTVTHNAPLISITISTKLVAASAPAKPAVDPLGPDFVIDPIPAKPVVDRAGDFAPGNVMSKGGPRRH